MALYWAAWRPGDPAHVHQPGPQRLLPVGQVPVLGVKGGQQLGPCRRPDRVGLLHSLQEPGQRRGRQARRVDVGQVADQGLQLL